MDLHAELAGFLRRDLGIGFQRLVPLGQVDEMVDARPEQGSQPAGGLPATRRARVLTRRESARNNPVGVRHRPITSTSLWAFMSTVSLGRFAPAPPLAGRTRNALYERASKPPRRAVSRGLRLPRSARAASPGRGAGSS